MSDSTSLIDQLDLSQSNITTRINETQDALSPAIIYGRRASTSTGLTWGYYGGRWGGNSIVNGTSTLGASTTSYIVVLKSTGAVSASTATTNWDNTADYARAYKVVTGASTVTSYEDHRSGANGTVGAGGGGGGLTNWTDSVSTAAPNATIPAVKLAATNSATDVDAVVSPKGTGSLLAQTPDNTATGGNKRGTYAVDWQMQRAAATQVASGANAAILSGYNNTASGAQSAVLGGYNNVASGAQSAVRGGRDNTASGVLSAVAGGFGNTVSSTASVVVGGGNNSITVTYSFIGAGSSNTVSGDYSGILAGSSNTASGANSGVGGGSQNTASGENSFIPGGRDGTTRGVFGASAHGSGRFAVLGDAQAGRQVHRLQTADATVSALSADGAAPVAATAAVLPNGSCYTFAVHVAARQNATGDAAGWKIEGVIKRGTGVASAALVGTPTVTSLGADAGASAWTVAAVANTTLGSLEIQVTGEAAKTIRWVANIQTVEVAG